MQTNRILTLSQAADILKINENTLYTLADSGQIPNIRLPASSGNNPQFQFNTFNIEDWLEKGPVSAVNDKAYIERWQKRLQRQFPQQLAMLWEYDKQFIAPRKPKGYSLSKAPNKKLGFIYHVRFVENGKIVPTWYSTHTNNLEAAEKFAVNNRERLLSEYHKKKDGCKNNGGSSSMLSIIKNYYEKDSPYLKKMAQRGRKIRDNTRKGYLSAIKRTWIPFLKKYRITTFEQIDTPLMAQFQDYCLAMGIKAISANHYVNFVLNIFDELVITGVLKTNPCPGLKALTINEDEQEARDCYHISELKGIFNKKWKNEEAYLLNLLIYSTGMRNSEIDRVQVKEIIRMGKCWFINIPKSKTRYGTRLVPLHDFVYNKLALYIKKHNKDKEDLLFCQKNGRPLPRQHYTKANIALGMFTRQNKEKTLTAGEIKKKLKEENIVFYSGRHFYKTMMNADDLGEVEEYFMGHKVSGDVAKRYNHRDRQGQERIITKAKEVFKILDKRLFADR